MRAFLLAATAGLSLAVMASPALAAWKETNWGASYEETLALLGDQATLHEDREGSRVWDQEFLISRPGRFAGVPVVEEFYFDEGRTLSLVRLQPLGGEAECDAFVSQMVQSLGEPIDTREQDLAQISVRVRDYADQGADNVMRLSHIKSPSMEACLLTFQAYGDGVPGERN